MKKSTKSLLSKGIAVLLALSMTACSGNGVEKTTESATEVKTGAETTEATAVKEEPSGDNPLIIAMTCGDIPNTDSEPTQGQEGYRFVSFQLYDALVKWDLSSETEPSKIIPGLAESWSQSESDAKEWMFELRQGVKFHDGTDFNADCVIFTLDRLLNKDFEYYSATCAASVGNFLGQIASWEKVDDYTVKIFTKDPYNYLIYDLPYIMIPGMAAVKEKKDAFADSPVGSGPFRFVSKTAGQELVLERNEAYWGDVPKTKTVILKPISDPSARLAALKSGEVNWVECPPVEAIQGLESEGYKIKTNDYPHAWTYILNTKRGPFAKKEVRQAMSYAIDREGLCRDLLLGVGEPLSQLMYAGSPWYSEEAPKYEYNPEKAKELLAEAGYPDGFKTSFVAPVAGSGNMFPTIMNEYIQKNLSEVGIQVELQMMDWNAVNNVMKNGFEGEYAELGALNSSFYTMFPTVFNKYCGSTGAFNMGGYSNPEYDELIKKANASPETEANQYFIEAEQIIAEEQPWIIVCNDKNLRVVAPNVEGLIQSQTWYADLSKILVK